MQYSNAANRIKLSNWRIDSDGLMRVTARVLSEGVYDYLPDESPDNAETVDGFVPQYIPQSAFTPDALKSLEGKPVVAGAHEWRTADNTNNDGFTVGSIAGTPKLSGGFVVADMLITDADTIADIKQGKLIEVSAGYDGTCETVKGTYNGKNYTATQGDLRFNHILLLPDGQGRCGHDVRIVNNKQKEGSTMPITIKNKYGNSVREYKFTNEEDAKVAENMAEEQKSFNAADLEAAVTAATEAKAQMDALKAEYDAAMKTVQEQKAQLDELTSAETQSALADEAAAQTADEDAILDTAVENEEIKEEEKEEVKNKLCNCKTFADRRAAVVRTVLGSGDASAFAKWENSAFDGAFETLAVKAQRQIKNAKKSTMGGASARVQNSQGLSTLERILRPTRLQNAKKNGKE